MKKNYPLVLMAVLLSGCSMTPDYHRPVVETPAQWSAGQGDIAEDMAGDIAFDWWTSFGNDELNALMEQALAHNHDLLAGVQRIEQSRANLKISGASLLPSADGSAGASRTRTNPVMGKSNYASNLNAGLNVSYELDLFGRNRAGVDAAQAGLRASEYDEDALALVVMGDVAQGYFSLLSLRERLAVADQNLANARDVLRVVQARVNEGMESDIELAQQETSVAASEASRASLLEQIINAENALAVLLGQPPQSIELSGDNLAGIRVPEITPQQPSSLLERRPDIRAAEQNLIGANADIGAARAAFFPSISLGLGTSVSLPAFGDPSTTAASLASSLAAPIFQGGRLEGGVEQASARQKELVENYKKAVLVSFQEVEDALAAVNTARQREDHLQRAAEQARRAYTLSKVRYDAGSIDFRTLLDTQGSQLSAEDNYAQARLERLSAAIALYKALGGGWSL